MSTPNLSNLAEQRDRVGGFVTSANSQTVSLDRVRNLPRDDSPQFFSPLLNTILPLDQLIRGKDAGELAKQMSKHWLKDAAKRIFHQPLRSFLELVVNSLDASLDAEKSVGKFGMGFMSILSFLEHPETQGASIHIETTFEEGKNQELSSYSMELDKEDEDYQILFQDIEAKKESGAAITITPKSGQFSKNTLDQLFTYCQSLQFYEHGKIEVKYEGATYMIGEGEEVLAWVTLQKDSLSVRDKGCGISKEIACKKLFVPSSSTKKVQVLRTYPPQLPTVKKYNGKKDDLSHFLISINGVLVIDLPLSGTKGDDLLLKMPPTTKLTLARDAVENRPATIRYLKSVILSTIEASFKSEEAASCLEFLYKGLKTWEEQVSSIDEAKLSTYLITTLQSTLKANPELIPYPLEHRVELRSLFFANDSIVALPSALLFDHFELFEQLLAKKITDKRKDLIAGKIVFFVENISKVSAFGLKNCLFAPLSFLADHPNLELLQCRLIHQFVDEGKSLDVYQAGDMKQALSNLRVLRPYLFCTGKDTPTNFNKISFKNLNLFIDADDTPFIEFWQQYGGAVLELWEAANGVLSWLHLAHAVDDESDQDVKLYLESTIIYDAEAVYRICDPEAAFVELKKMAKSIIKDGPVNGDHFDQLEKVLPSSDFSAQFLRPMAPYEISKLFFSWFFAQIGTEGMIFTAEEILWPIKELTFEHLKICFQIFVEKRAILASRALSTLESQMTIWQTLESFMDYPDHAVAIKAVLPLLLLQEVLLKGPLSHHQQEKLRLAILQITSCYQRFYTIKLGEVPVAYGTTLPPIWKPFESLASVHQIADLLISLVDKPSLFEKCLDLLTDEMGNLLEIEKRNKGMIRSLVPNNFKEYSQLHSVRSFRYYYVYSESICSRNPIAFLSLAMAKGVDAFFIETVLQHVTTPFELTVLSLFLLSKPNLPLTNQNKEKIAQVLIYFVTVYLQQKNARSYEEIYKEQLAIGSESPTTFFNKMAGLISPMVSYFEEIEGANFDIDLQMIEPLIAERLSEAKDFTSIQVIHAASHDDQFAQALREGNLKLAVESASKELRKTELQMVSHAVEHGSERTYFAATLMEAFQNAVDAIRGFIKKHPEADSKKTELSFDVRIANPKNPHLLLEITDHIGMQSLETLLADFLIPNYSQKGKEKEAVGEMGNGSYQMYREAEMVTVKTRTLDDPSRAYYLRIVPIRDFESQEVVDLSHKCVDITDIVEEEFEGTTIRVLMKNKNSRADRQIALEIEGMAIRNFISDTFSLYPNNVKCMLKLPNGRKKILAGIKKEIPPFQSPNSIFSCHKMEYEEMPGYVLTDGYPFKPLKTFLIEEKILPHSLCEKVACGWCLNLPKGSYAPVQSRTRVQMKQEIKEQLQHFLLELIYVRSCFNEKSGLETNYYPHMKAANSDFRQVLPSRPYSTGIAESVLTKGDFASLEAFFVHYRPYFLQKSFLEYIHDGYRELVAPLEAIKFDLSQQIVADLTPENREILYPKLIFQFKIQCMEIVKSCQGYLQSNDPYEALFFKNVIWPWFEKKIATFINQPPSLNELVVEHPHLQSAQEKVAKKIAAAKIEMTQDHIKEYLTTAATVLSYYSIYYFERTPIQAGQPPKIRFIYTKMNLVSAYYTAVTNEIVVNLAYNPLSHLLKLGQKLAHYEPIRDESLISISYRSSGILNHELEHARRGHSCDGKEDVHGHDYNCEGNYVDFEACAASYAKAAHQAGLFEKMAHSLQGLHFPTAVAIAQLQRIEREHPEIIIESLGL